MPIATADLYDGFADELQSSEVQYRTYGKRKAFHGPAATVKCHEDNLLLRQLVASPGQGRVLVVDGGGSLRSALMGDVLAGIAMKSGWAGAVIHGAIRDGDLIDGLDFGVKALGANPRLSTKTGAGIAEKPVSFGGITVKPGDWVYCDSDGVVVAGRPVHQSMKT